MTKRRSIQKPPRPVGPAPTSKYRAKQIRQERQAAEGRALALALIKALGEDRE